MLARRPRVPLYGVALCAGLFLLLLLVAYVSPRARYLDASALQGFIDVPKGERGASLVARVASLGDPAPVALIALALAGVAFLRGRPRIALTVVSLVAVTSVSGQLLKTLLSYPRYLSVVQAKAFPSGHSTAAMTLALCGVLVSPGRLRPLAAAVGLAFALGVAFGVVSLGWHYPSDVVGGFLLATGWTLAAVSALLWLEEKRPERPGRLATGARGVVDRVAAIGLVSVVVGGIALAGLAVAAVLLTRGSDVVDFVDRHTAAAVVGAGIAAACGVLVAAVTVLLRRGE